MKRELHLLTRSDVEALISATPDTPAGARDRCVIAMMYRMGLRIGEVLGLEMGDVRRIGNDLIARVEKPKGYRREKGASDPRELLVDDYLEPHYLAHLTHRGIAPGPLFANQQGQKISTAYYRKRLRQLANQAGVQGRVHPHGLRHCFAHEFHRQARDVRLLQKALGHSNLGTTENYIQHIGSAPEVIEAMRARAL